MSRGGGRERLKFMEFDFQRLPDGQCRARVVLERHPGSRFEGEATGLGSPTGELRCAAQASTNALQQAVEDQLQFELLGVKAVRAFDATVVEKTTPQMATVRPNVMPPLEPDLSRTAPMERLAVESGDIRAKVIDLIQESGRQQVGLAEAEIRRLVGGE